MTRTNLADQIHSPKKIKAPVARLSSKDTFVSTNPTNMKNRTTYACRLPLLLCSIFVAAMCVAQDHCWIKYSYDAAGNRIKREWWCGTPGEPDPGGEEKSARDFGFRLAPVPALDELTLTSERVLEHAELQIANAQGRVVLKGTVNGTRTVLNVSLLAAGLYILRLREPLVEFTSEFTILR